MPNKRPQRRSIRIKDYDYSQDGGYFITICLQNRELLFGEIVDAQMQLSIVGKMIQKWWQELENKFPNVVLGQYIIMPNHLHGIIHINWRTHRSAPTIGDMVQWFKTMSTNEYIRGVKSGKFTPFEKSLWQRNYWEHVIRNDNDLDHICEYIINNPYNWQNDDLYC